MKKRILSCLMALALCLTLLPTAALAEETEGTAQTPPAVEESADPANGEAKQENQSAAPEEENQSTEQEEQQEDSASKQDEAVAAVQAMIDALPDAAKLDGMDDADAMAVYETFQAACDAYYDLTEGQRAQLKNTEKLEALSKWFSQSAALAAGTEHQHPICGDKDCSEHGKSFSDWQGVSTLTAEMEAGHYYLTDYVTIHSTWKPKDGVVLCLNGYGITLDDDGPAIQVQPGVTFTLCDCNGSGYGRDSRIAHSGGTKEKYGIGVLVGALDNLDKTAEFNMYGGTIGYNMSISDGKVEGGGVTVAGGTFNMYGGTISNNKSLSGKGIGGGVFIANHGTFNMTGGEITGNTSGGGVYVNYYPTTFTVSSTAKITGNKSGGETSNVYLSKGTIGSNVTYANPIEVGTLDSTASIGVTTADVGQTVATGVSQAAKGCFTSDNSKKYRLKYENNTLTMIAATEHTAHPVCGASCTHDGTHTGESWTPISDLSEIKGNGNYYLTDNVKLTASWTSGSYNGRNVKLCLNGFDIIANVDDSAIKLNTYDGNTLTLCDCVGGGKITHGVKADGSKYIGAGVEVPGKQIFNMYGGTITGNKCSTSGSYGSGVHVDSGACFNMHGGSITGNENTVGSYGYGAGVYVNKGTFNMTGGSITKNTAMYGAGVWTNVSFTVSGAAKIIDNSKDNAASNVYLADNNKPITIGEGGLAASAKIGVTTGHEDNIESGKYVTVATGAANSCPADNFFADKGEPYGIKVEQGADANHVNVNLYNGLPHKHPICGTRCTHTGSDVHTDVVWTLLTSDTNGTPSVGSTALGTGKFNTTVGYVLPAGHYYLNAELALDKPLLIKNGVYLCLNGQTLTVSSNNSAVIIDTGCDLTLCDCSEEQPGKITHAANATGRGVYMGASQGRDDSYNGSFTMYGGSITGNHIAANSGAGVYMRYGTFNMHGGSITGNTTAENHGTGGVYVSGGKFNMTGGSITATGGGVRVDSQGTFNMSGNAVISNNNAYYGGVYVYAATFNMSGNASVSGNTASYGGGVYVGAGTASAAAKFNMSGNASISGNIANYGGGVYVYGSSSFTMSEKAAITGNNVNNDGGGVYVNGYTATMTVSGDVQIKDNWQDGSKNDKTGVYEKGDDSSANNFYLFGEDETKQQTITIGGVLETTARIGVTTCLTPTAGNPIKIATGATGDLAYYTNIFTPDVTDYTVTKDGTTLYLSAHEHHWKYEKAANGEEIMVSCDADGCDLNGQKIYYTLRAPATSTLTYDGNGKPARVIVTGAPANVTTPQPSAISYMQTQPTQLTLENGAEPTNAGTYYASVTVGTETATVTYEIKKATPQASDFTFTAPQDLTYNGNAKSAVVEAKNSVTGMGNITVKYYQGENKVDPINAGDYTVKISVDGTGNNFNATTTELTMNGWAFVITADRTAPTVELPADTTYTYNGQRITPAVVVKVGDKTLTEDDYTVVYGDNINAGKNAGSVTVKAKGNYGFADKTVKFTIDKKMLSANELEFTDAEITKAYDGTVKCENATVRINSSAKVNEGDTLPAVSGSCVYNSANVQKASKVTFTSQKTESENYILPAGLKVEHAAKITKANQAALTVTSTTATYGEDLTLTIDGGSGTGAVTYTVRNGTGEATLNGSKLHPTKAGTVFVTATKAGDNNYEAVTSAEKEINIAKAIYIGTASKTVNIVKGLTTAQTGTLTAADFFPEGQMPADAEIANVTPDSGTMMAGMTVKAVGHALEYRSNENITATEDETYTVTIAATNYNDIKATLTFYPTNKLSQDGFKFENSGVTKTYGDPEFSAGAVGAVKGSTVTYESSKPAVATVDSTGNVTIKGAGTAVITAKASATAEYDEASATCTLTVEKKTVTVKAKDQTAYVGDKVPTLGADSYTVSGLVGKDTLTTQPTAKYVDAVGKETTPDMTKTGETIIRASGAVASDNYTIRYEDGKLTVSTRPSGGGGGSSSGGGSSGGGGGSSRPSTHPVKAEVSKDPDGSVSLSKTSAAKGDKVTITVKPEQHYEVDEVIVRDSKGKQLAVKDNGDGTYTFEMPADKVTVEPTFSWVNPFADVADSAYYVDAVEWMLKRELTQGTTETTFAPNLNCTRAQIVTFLWRAAGSPEAKGTVSFADVSAGSYYAKAVAWAIENGITGGTGDGLFSPDATCTRAQSAAFLYRAAGSPAVGGSAGFSDVAADAYYAQAVAWAKEHGITDGIGGGLFGSANDCTRAQIAAFLYRYMK